MTTTELRAKYLAKLAESGLTKDHARKLHFQLLNETQARQLHSGARAGFKIPYHEINGKQNGFWRLRLLEPNTNGWDRLVGIKPKKYLQAPGAPPRLYFPPLLNWLETQERHLYITEGELKAAAACAQGLACLGLGGLWNFTVKGSKRELLEDFNLLRLDQLTITIVVDSDGVANLHLQMAAHRLCELLLAKGTNPNILILPQLGTGKTGLDDLLVAKGKEFFLTEVLPKAEKFEKARELFALNEKVVYVENPGFVLRRSNLQHIRPSDFVQHVFADHTYYEEVPHSKGTRIVKRKAPQEWLEWPARAHVPKVNYAPGEPEITDKGEYNTWPGWGLEPKPGDTSLFHQLLQFLTKGEEHILPWLLQWLAYPLQHPGAKMFVAVLVWSIVHGTGKSFLGYIMGDIYGENFVEIGSEDLFADFNVWTADKQFVMATEISSTGKRSPGDRLKQLISQERKLIKKKYIDAYPVRDCSNFLFTSNHVDALFLEDSDRRFCIVEVEGDPLPLSFYKELDRWRKAGGPAHVLDELLRLDLTGFDPRAKAPTTRAKEEMIAASRSDVADWVARLKEDPDRILHKLGGSLIPGALFSTDELFNIYNPYDNNKVTKNGLSRALKTGKVPKANRGLQLEKGDGKGGKKVLPRVWVLREHAAIEQLNRRQLFDRYQAELEERLRVKF
jgi:hypothetical protein